MKVGIIGGSGLYNINGIENLREETLATPFGIPSDSYLCGTLSGVECVFLARHGRGHKIMPSEINFQANIWGMKKLGVEKIISVSAVGSFREEMAPRDIVCIDQFVDRTKRGIEQTFFGEGVVAHIAFADPICADMRNALFQTAAEILPNTGDESLSRPPQAHNGGTYLNMEGPAFSTRAESFLYKSWGMDVIGMTNMAEARLAREAEICYATMAMVTDYDCWHDAHEDVTVEMVIKTLCSNAAAAETIIKTVLPRIAALPTCACNQALKTAIITQPDAVPADTGQKLEILLEKYFQ